MATVCRILFFSLGILSPLWGQDFRSPRRIVELGYAQMQTAYRVPADFGWADFERLPEVYDPLRGRSHDRIEKVIGQGARLTALQLDFARIFFDFDFEISDPRFAYHPRDYHRGLYLEWLDDDGLTFLGLSDTKGNGIGPGAERWMRELVYYFAVMRGELGLTDEAHEAARRNQMFYIEGYSKIEAQLKSGGSKHEADLRFQLEKLGERLQVYRVVLDYFKSLRHRHPGPAPERTLRKFLSVVRNLDYTHGFMRLTRVVREVIVARAARRIFGEYNRAADDDLSTIEPLFILAPKIYVRANGGKSRVGILGRRPHWRMGNHRRLTLPPELGVGSKLSGAVQFDAFGRMVDFEMITVDDERLWPTESRGMSFDAYLDAKIETAVQRFEEGHATAISDLIAECDRAMAAPRVRPFSDLSRPTTFEEAVDVKGDAQKSRAVFDWLANAGVGDDADLRAEFLARPMHYGVGADGAALGLAALTRRPDAAFDLFDRVGSSLFCPAPLPEYVFYLQDWFFAAYQVDPARAAQKLREIEKANPGTLRHVLPKIYREILRREALVRGVSLKQDWIAEAEPKVDSVGLADAQFYAQLPESGAPVGREMVRAAHEVVRGKRKMGSLSCAERIRFSAISPI